jgi:endoglucanase
MTLLWIASTWLALTGGSPQGGPNGALAKPGIEFWDQRRKGANCQNHRVRREYWQAAHAAGIQFIRLAPDGWSAANRDFLIGSADTFRTIDTTDLAVLRHVLDDAAASSVGVILTMFSLPGARWRQLNGDKDDGRLWTQPEYRAQAFAFWRQLAAALTNHPAIVAYNPLNEPHPERAFGLYDESAAQFGEWYRGARGTAADLNEFNRGIVSAIREVDPDTPIILDGWTYASPQGLTFLEPVEDPAVLYAFHYGEPWDYTTFRVNQNRFIYPTRMPDGWTPETPARLMGEVAAWADRHHVPARHIIAEEFHVDRRVGGATQYLQDVIALLDRHDWSWAFYSFRADDAWGGLDYELGTAPLGEAYWAAVERGEDPERHKHRGANPLWDVLTTALAGP